MSIPIGSRTRLRWSYDALDAAFERYNDARGGRPGEAFAAAAEVALWSATLDEFYRKRHPQMQEYIALRGECEDGKTVRALAVYRNRIAHFIEVPHEGIRSGFSDQFSDEFVKFSHHFLPLGEVSFDDAYDGPRHDADGEKLYAEYVAAKELREVLERVQNWWARCRSEFADPAPDSAN